MNLSLKETAFQGELAVQFANGKPLPLVMLDNFLPREFADGLLAEIQANTDFQKSNDYIFAKNKFESSQIERLGPYGESLRKLLLSREFADALSQMYGKPLIVDPEFVGGGLHRGGEGSFLDMHTDFGLHPRNRLWIRELNILLYLNKDWHPDYGGCLDLRNSHNNATASIEPYFNRLVVMLTKDFTFHGYKPIRFPPGTYRTSIATYAYSEAASYKDVSSLKTTTTWMPETGGPMKKFIARFTPSLVMLKQHLFGSTTAKKKQDKNN